MEPERHARIDMGSAFLADGGKRDQRPEQAEHEAGDAPSRPLIQNDPRDGTVGAEHEDDQRETAQEEQARAYHFGQEEAPRKAPLFVLFPKIGHVNPLPSRQSSAAVGTCQLAFGPML